MKRLPNLELRCDYTIGSLSLSLKLNNIIVNTEQCKLGVEGHFRGEALLSFNSVTTFIETIQLINTKTRRSKIGQ